MPLLSSTVESGAQSLPGLFTSDYHSRGPAGGTARITSFIMSLPMSVCLWLCRCVAMGVYICLHALSCAFCSRKREEKGNENCELRRNPTSKRVVKSKRASFSAIPLLFNIGAYTIKSLFSPHWQRLVSICQYNSTFSQQFFYVFHPHLSVSLWLCEWWGWHEAYGAFLL